MIELVGLLPGLRPGHGGVLLPVVGEAVYLDINNVYVEPYPSLLIYLGGFLCQDSGSVMALVPSLRSSVLITYRTLR